METRELVYKKLSALTSKKFNDESDIYNIGIDSLDLVELVTEIEDEYNVVVSDEKLAEFATVGDIVKEFEALNK